MKSKSYDVFISYRREGGLDFARSIAYYLRIEGLQCFFDQRELKTGQFNQQKYTATVRSLTERDLRMADIRIRFAKEMFSRLMMSPPDRPVFAQ